MKTNKYSKIEIIMKPKIKIKNPFRVKEANELYKIKGELNSDCQEYGIDENGNVYFHYLNGITNRFTRKQFIKKSRVEKNVF